MKQFIYSTEGGEFFIKTNIQETVAILSNYGKKQIYGRDLIDLKRKIENYLIKDLGARLQDFKYLQPASWNNLPYEVTKESFKIKVRKSRSIFYQTHQLAQRLIGQYECVWYFWTDHYLKSLCIDLIHHKIISHPSGVYAESLLNELASKFTDGILGVLDFNRMMESRKLTGVTHNNKTVLCDLVIAEDKKSFILKDKVRKFKPGSFKYFIAHYPVKISRDYSFFDKFPELLPQNLDIF